MAKYLDDAGVTALWAKCKATFIQTVNNTGPDANGNATVSAGSSLPAYTSSNANYVLSVNSNGELVWKAPYDGAASGS